MNYLLNLPWNSIKAMANESWFIYYYLGDCRGNGVQAYRKVFPEAKYQSAKASASRLLKKPTVIQTMNRKLEKLGDVEKTQGSHA